MLKLRKPMTPGQRGMTYTDYSVLTKKRPEKSLLSPKKERAGRNNRGCITIRHRGGGHKKRYRKIDFNMADKKDIPGKVAAIEYDPNRTAFIALIIYKDGEKRYIISPDKLKVNDSILTGSEKVKAKVGNRMKLQYIPEGFLIHNIELYKGKGGQIIRSAGTYAKLVSVEKIYAQVQMPSGEIRLIHRDCYASIGIVSNIDYSNITLGKAGRKRWMGKRPSVKGKNMNPCDHPHGGGEGHSPIGLKHPKTPWGMPALGFKTRKRKYTNKFIIKDRRRK